MSEERQCRACRKPIPVGMLACRMHWYLLPKPLRDAILTTYRGGDRKSYVENVKSADKVWQELGVKT